VISVRTTKPGEEVNGNGMIKIMNPKSNEVTLMLRKWTVVCNLALCLSLLPFGASAAPDVDTASAGAGGTHWPASQALPSFKEPRHLDVANLYDAPGDVKLMMATLQGIVNRERPRIYLIQNSVDPWYDSLTVPYTMHDDAMDIFDKYKDEVNGVIVYDPEVPDSINVATTLAGLEDAVVVSPSLAEILTAAPYELDIVEDFRGAFEDKMDAYNWQYENLWERTTHRMLVGLSPDTSIRIPPGMPESFETIAQETRLVRDASNRATYEYDVSEFLGNEAVYVRFDDAFPQDGWGPAVNEITVEADGEVIAHFETGTAEEEQYLYDRHGSKFLPGSDHRFADHGNYFVYEFFPPEGTEQLTVSVEMWNQYKVSAGNVRPLSSETKEPYGYLRDYAVANRAMVFWLAADVPEQRELFERILSDVEPGTPYLGWFSNDYEGEVASIDIASKHSVYVLPADWFHNMTVFAGTKPETFAPEQKDAPPLENKIYVTFTFGEGDNLQYNLNHMREILWEDPARGDVPVNWSSSPLLLDAAPAVYNFYRSTATENDYLVAGPSGAGYFSPHAWPNDTMADYFKASYEYLQKSGMTIPFVLNRDVGTDLPLGESEAAAYAEEYKVPGVLLGAHDFGIEIVNGTLPVSMQPGVGTAQDGINRLNEAKAEWDGESPLFLSLGINAWGMRPADVVKIAEALGPEFEIVTADKYFDLVREAYGLPEASRP